LANRVFKKRSLYGYSTLLNQTSKQPNFQV
jgi:hypothetical protein